MPGEGRLLLGCGASGVGRSPTPDCPPSGRAAGAHYPLAVGAGGCGRGDPSQTPQRALLRAGFARCGGGMRVPRGAPPAWVWGVRGRALSHSRMPALWAGCRGPLPAGCGCGGVRAWGPVRNPTARALASWLRVLWGRHEGAQGGRLLPGCGASGVGRSPTHDCPPSGRAAGAHYPLAVGAGGCGRGDPSPTPQRALLRACFARCGGGTRVPGGGRPLPWCGASVVGRSPTPDCPPSGRAAGAHYPLAANAGGCGRGDQSPTPQRALLRASFVRCGGGMRVPGGAPLAWVWGVRGRALSHPQLPALWAGCRGPLPTGCRCGGVRASGPVTNPTARALSSWLCALWEWHEGAGGGAPPAWVWGVRGRALSHPRLPALWAGCRGPLPTDCGCGGMRAWGPVTNPTARALSSWLCALWGRHEGAGGGASCLGVRRPGSGALRPPTACPLGGLLGPTTHLLWGRGGAGVGTRHQPHSARSFELALRAVGAARGRPGGGRLLPGRGASGVERSPTPDCPPSWRAAGAHYPLAVGAGGCGRGDPSPTPQRASASWLSVLLGRHEDARGGASCLGVGRPGSGALPPPTARPLGGLPGPTTHWLSVRGGAGVGTRHQPDSARSFELALRAVGVARGRRGGGASCLGVGRAGSGALPPPTARPLGGLPGPTTH